MLLLGFKFVYIKLKVQARCLGHRHQLSGPTDYDSELFVCLFWLDLLDTNPVPTSILVDDIYETISIVSKRFLKYTVVCVTVMYLFFK